MVATMLVERKHLTASDLHGLLSTGV
jgi:hypothetical protein